jgi:hypothetical protein
MDNDDLSNMAEVDTEPKDPVFSFKSTRTTTAPNRELPVLFV